MAAYAHPIAIQTAYLQLRYCAEPRVAHLLRVADPRVIAGGATAHDSHILRGLNALLGPGDLLQLDDQPAAEAWKDAFEEHGRECPTQDVFDYMSTFAIEQARLPMRHGGLGLTSAVASAPAALVGGQCRTASFLARESNHSITVDVDQYVGNLCEGTAPSGIAFRAAWVTCQNILRPWSDIVGGSVETLIGVATPRELPAATPDAQTRLARGCADARSRGLLESIRERGDVGSGLNTIVANRELARLHMYAAVQGVELQRFCGACQHRSTHRSQVST